MGTLKFVGKYCSICGQIWVDRSWLPSCSHPMVGCRIIQLHFLRKPQQCHRFAEALYDWSLQKPWISVCETLLVNYPQMSSARGRALSEQRRHPIHRAKKPWTNTKRPASNQPQNKRGETQAIAVPSWPRFGNSWAARQPFALCVPANDCYFLHLHGW